MNTSRRLQKRLRSIPESMTDVPGVPAKSRSIYAAMVDEMDQGIGRLMKTLDRLELTDNTVIWFLSDHGGLKRTSDNRPLRGAKGNAYEGGIRVPFLVRWPKHVKPGTLLRHPVTSLDIGATSLALAGGNVKQAGLHGSDITPYMTGHSTDAPHDVIYWHVGRSPQTSPEYYAKATTKCSRHAAESNCSTSGKIQQSPKTLPAINRNALSECWPHGKRGTSQTSRRYGAGATATRDETAISMRTTSGLKAHRITRPEMNSTVTEPSGRLD